MRPHFRTTLVIAVLLLLSAGTSALCGKIVYVNTTGSDTADGLTWSTAKKTVQAGINAAVAGDDVWVAAGTYVECVTLKDGVGLYGGFAGTETLRVQRDWRTNSTIIDADRKGSVVTALAGITSATCVDGFTLQNGTWAMGGGGVRCSGSAPVIRHNRIIRNQNCGVYCSGGSTALITGNSIAANTGGGVRFESAVQILGNTIFNNRGSGIVNGSNGTSTGSVIANNVIVGNSGTGVSVNSSLKVVNNTIVANAASGVTYYSTPVISNNIIAFNSSGVYRGGGTAVLRNNDVYNPGGTNYHGTSVGTGDISVDPGLVAYAYGEVHILPTSPCRNAGSDADVVVGWTDLDGQTRKQGAHVDIGADESDGTTLTYTPAVVYVSPNGDDTDGSSWAHAKRGVQAGIDVATLTGGDVWVAAGTYVERVSVPSFVYLYGGFSGNETNRNARNWSFNKSVLDGNAGGTVVQILAGHNITCLDGFTVRNGAGSPGGGVNCSQCSTRIENNVVTKNSGANGAGICCTTGLGTIRNNLVSWNTAGEMGGGILGGNEVAGNTVVGNTAGYSVGGMAGGTVAQNNIVKGNQSSFGGGMGEYGSIIGNVITGNSAWAGAGLWLDVANSRSVTVVNNTIVGNGAETGGGVYCEGMGPVLLANNLIAYNSNGVSREYSNAPLTLKNNAVHNPAGYNYEGIAPGPTDISVDPLIVDPAFGETHLQPGSPCIGAGDDAAISLAWLDIDGQARRQGTHVDIGADECDGVTRTFTPAIVRVGPTGDDSNDGSSWSLPKRTVQAGIAMACQLGGYVWVAAGTYRENLLLPAYAYLYGGFSGNESVLSDRDWARNRTILQGDGTGSVIATTGHSATTIDGFTITGGVTANNIGAVDCEYSSASIANNIITRNGVGVSCSGSSSRITGNVVVSNNGMGICDRGPNSLISGNTVIANAGEGISGGPGTLTNNIVAWNGIGVKSSTTIALRGNCVYGNGTRNYLGVTDPTGIDGNISTDPLLVAREYGEFRLLPTSPCRDAGVDSDAAADDRDIDHQMRIQGTHVDIGADEADGSTPSFTRAIIRVSPEGDDSHDGSTWETAKRTVQGAIDTAKTNGGEVWVASGVYNERIVLAERVHLFGGFAGTEEDRSSRAPLVHETILDGGQAGTVVKASYMGFQTCTIDGFTIRNGKDPYTGGIYCNYASPLIAGNRICRNRGDYRAGGIYCLNTSLTVIGNRIDGNTGYGISFGYCTGGTVSGNTIVGNTGRGISCSTTVANILSNTIAGNLATDGAGGINIASCDAVVANNVIAFNSSGIHNDNGFPSKPFIYRGNNVYGNTSYDSWGVNAKDNNSADPLFADKAGGDYHLGLFSPCINTGWNDAPDLPTTDMDGEARIQGGTVDIGADECWLSADVIRDAKRAVNGMQVDFTDAVVTAAFDGFFYIEAADRSMGIRVEKAGHGLAAGARVSITGALKTNADGERCIEASTIIPTGAGTIEPLHIVSRYLGGVDWFYSASTGSGQKGVVGGVGLNNIGMLVTTWGKISYLNGAYGLDDTKIDAGKTVLDGIRTMGLDTYARVTGVVSCYKDAAGLHPTILATEITPL